MFIIIVIYLSIYAFVLIINCDNMKIFRSALLLVRQETLNNVTHFIQEKKFAFKKIYYNNLVEFMITFYHRYIFITCKWYVFHFCVCLYIYLFFFRVYLIVFDCTLI